MTRSVVAQRVEQEHLAFALRLHRALAPDPSTPACWSPFSVASALGLAATGARGRTRDELTTLLLGDPGGSLTEHAALLAAATELDQPAHGQEPPLFGVANTFWARPDIPVEAEFAEELLRWPNGALRDAPFAADPEGARKLINAEVAETTHNLIPQLIPSGAIKSDTVAALVNALYLKVAWVNRFPDRATRDLAFHAPEGTVEVPTMHLSKRVGYAAAQGWQAVSLPAAGGVDAIVLLPDGDLAEAEAGLDETRLGRLLGELRPSKVDLYLPKFRAALRSELTSVLGGLGVHEVFTRGADLSGISSEPLSVSAVLHEAVLSIDEQGLEGAAATAVMVKMAMAMTADRTVEVRVDRPFLLLVRHRASGAIYFLTRVVRPLTGGRA